MTDYNEQVAYHYSAYRPPLHQRILQEVLGGMRFQCGLDLGCGTGRSTMALKSYCDEVCGVEPSPEMLAHAKPQPGVTFLTGSAEQIPCRPDSFDVITMAGCLFYADRPSTAVEVARVGRSDALVVVYDFEIEVGRLMEKLCPGWVPPSSDYDHAVRFHEPEFLKVSDARRVEADMAFRSLEMVHLLFSDHQRFVALDCSEEALKARLEEGDFAGRLPVRLYWSTYTVA